MAAERWQCCREALLHREVRLPCAHLQHCLTHFSFCKQQVGVGIIYLEYRRNERNAEEKERWGLGLGAIAALAPDTAGLTLRILQAWRSKGDVGQTLLAAG